MASEKILVLVGSPRAEGNTSILVDHLREGAEAGGAQVEVVRLHDLHIRPCTACRACKDDDAADCILEDDMRSIYPKIRGADAIVFASPIYWWNVSAQTKLLIDRCDALDGPSGNVLGTKRIAIALVYGGSDAFSSGAVNALRAFQDAFRYVGSDVVGMIHGSAWEEGSIRENERLLAQARELGERLATPAT
jgi:multimeric flavodoxin WrbA